MSFYKNTLYVHPGDTPLEAFRMVLDPSTDTMVFDTTPIAMAGTSSNPTGDSTTISANGSANGIVWDLNAFAEPYSGPAVLTAYDASNVTQLYSSASNPADQAGSAVKFTVPTVAGGQVFVGTGSELDIYGLLSRRPRHARCPCPPSPAATHAR